jgi:hypothetical protein
VTAPKRIKTVGFYDPAANGYDLDKDPRCLFGWGPPPEKNPGTPPSCRCRFGHSCAREFKHPGKCWDGTEGGPSCNRAQRPRDWDAQGRREANE